MTTREIAGRVAQLWVEPMFTDQLATASSTQDVIELLGRYGLHITEEELDEVMDLVPTGPEGELAEDVLENVSGGGVISSMLPRIRAIFYFGGGGGGGGHGF